MINFPEDEESIRLSSTLSTATEIQKSGWCVQTMLEKNPEKKLKLFKKKVETSKFSSSSKNVTVGVFSGIISLHWRFPLHF